MKDFDSDNDLDLQTNCGKIEMKEKLIEKIKEWHKYVVIGLNNGLTHTIQDGRQNDIKWVRGRLELFESFSRCIMDEIWGNPNESNEKDLKEIAEEGYTKGDLE